MQSRLVAIFLALALVLEVRSDDVLKCYMCTSLTDEGCGSDPQTQKIKPVECTFERMVAWQKNLQQHQMLQPIASFFEVDSMHNYPGTPKDMACAKMNFKIANQDVSVRSCQTAKTENIDPCKTIDGRLTTGSMDYCGLCLTEACNSSSLTSPRMLYAFISILGSLVFAQIYRGA